MSLRDPVRSFWISTLDCLRIFVFLVKKDFFFHTDFFSLSILFLGIFKQGSSFLLHWLIFKSILYPLLFPLLAGKLGTMGPGFI